MLFLTTVFILSVVHLVSSETYYGDHCTVTDFMHDNPFEDKTIIYMKVLNDCDNGTVYWNYPMGSALLNATRTGQYFEFCIETSYATALGGVQLKSGVAKGPLQVPTEDNPTCIKSLHGEAAFLIQAPSSLRYVVVFNYRVTSPAPA